jgi:hypothetical protein
MHSFGGRLARAARRRAFFTMTPGIRQRLSDERGSALIELLVAIPTALAVGAAIATISGAFGSSQAVTQVRSETMADQQVATDRLTREIRQAKTAANLGTDKATLQITTLSDAAVRFVCATDPAGATRTCRRQVPQANGTWPAANSGTTLMQRVVNSDVFTVDGAFVDIRLEVRSPDGERALTLGDGAGLANAP